MKNVSKNFEKVIAVSKKTLIIFVIFLFCIFNSISKADIQDAENLNINSIKKEDIQTSAKNEEEILLNSQIGLIFDRNSKQILYEKNGLKQVPMASTTKIMTAIVALKNANLKDVVIVDRKAANTGGSRLGLKTNDEITVNDLLYGLMLKSGNDAAVALAIHVGGSVENFANLMNKQAKELGLVNSHFVTPHGLDQEKHYTTAYELAYMADYALNMPKFKEIVSCKQCNVIINGQSKNISNTNELLGNLNGVYGVKTGFTNGAGRCLVTACKRDRLDIITVVLGANTKKIRTLDSIKMIEYAYKNYEVINLQDIVNKQFDNWKLLNEKRIYIDKGKTNYIQLEIEQLSSENMAIRKEDVDNIKTEINSLYNFKAPVLEKQIVGSAKIQLKDKTIATLNITNKKTIEKKGVGDYFIKFLMLLP